MINEAQKFTNWKEVIVNFLECNISKIKTGQKCELFASRVFIEKKETEIEKEKDEKKLNRLIKAKEEKEKTRQKLRNEAPSTEVREWLNKVTDKEDKRAPIRATNKIANATHVLKFTHTSSVAGSLHLKEKANDVLVTTSSMKKELVLDLAHNDGALISISRFLALELSDRRIIDLINEKDFSFFDGFYESKKQLNNWCNVFTSLIDESEIKTADKAKQIFFPINNNINRESKNYHILVPLFASSLMNEVDTKIIDYKYGIKQKNINQAIKVTDSEKSTFHNNVSLKFRGLAVMHYGGDHPKNVSMLNANRSGNGYLFSTQPPTWEKQLKPPIYTNSFFYQVPLYIIKEDIDYLSKFLSRFKSLDLSIKDPNRRKHLERWVNSIIDSVFFYVASIQNLPSGWSNIEGIKLDTAHQYFLDPYRIDKEFKAKREAGGWQKNINEDFANWLNYQLKKKDKTFTPQEEHKRKWIELFKTPLREDVESIKAVIKQESKREVKA